MKASELVAKLQSAIWENGDREIYGYHETDETVNGMDFSQEFEFEINKVSVGIKNECFYMDLEVSK